MDVWALGCVLYYMMYGASPFEHVLGEAGGSLALAVMNGKVIWPKAPRLRYPEDLHALVLKCLDINPATRPHVHAVVSQLQNIATKW